MQYITVKEAAEKWGVTTRHVQELCSRDLIPGAARFSDVWIIPASADKPKDGRRKIPVKSQEKEIENLTVNQNIYDNNELFMQIVKSLPYAMHICTPDGIMQFANDEYLKFAKISHPEKLYGKHNIKLNPNLERWGISDFVIRAFRGEFVQAYNVKVPLREIVDRLGDEKDLVYGIMYQDMTAFPIRDTNGKLIFIGFIFIISKYYQGKEEVIKGKEYIDENWNIEFDACQTIKRELGMTPSEYRAKMTK